MATSAVKGRLCRIRLSTPINTAGTIFNEVRNWSITPTQEMIDASSCDSSGWDEYIPGQRGFVFKAETVYSPANTITGVGSSGVARDVSRLIRSLIEGSPIYGFSVEVNASPVTGSTHSGRWMVGNHGGSSTVRAAALTNVRVGGNYKDIQLFEFEITGTQTMTYTTSNP